ncbi:MAG: TIGR00159 family protein [Halobacteriovoraceae bacterium]|nr:TIGR00159 family protein [Halobacteriovoraceae bacterium]|tara:strand:+ start:8387 stop:9184 length:798 start_codon:yes stop_codon:yes gene_type:complete
MDILFSLFENFTLTDSLDIIIVAIILYQFFTIIQGTRAVQVLVGTAAIATLYWFSLSMELYSLNWLLQHFFDYFFVIVIILFQEQIRSALAIFGNAGVFTRKKNQYYDTQIEEMISACMALRREKTGALIVIERNHGLLNYSATGTRMDSKIHSDLLYTIFQPSSPLHDGAVIIYQNRIQSAGCFLPLSKNIDLDRHIGTRHRAALGISEVSDALVLVVSEESGKISLCINGRFIHCEDESTLRAQLRMHLYSAKEREAFSLSQA